MIRIASWLLIALLIPIQAFAANKIIWSLAEHQPDTREGGRASSVAVNPLDETELLAATPTGGLFKSTDRGLSWRHVDELKVTLTQAVVYLSSGVIMVSAKADFNATNGGGVWRSVDGGLTWTQPDLVSLIVPAFTGRLSAFGISASGNNVIVGTSKGVFVSTNGGASWNWSNPFPLFDVDLVSVLITSGKAIHLYAGGSAGVTLNTFPFGPQWAAPNTAVPGIFTLHAFRRSPLSSSAAFVLAGHNLLRTENDGTTWTGIPVPLNAPVGCGGATFIQVALNAAGDALDLYHGDVCRLDRLSVPLIGGVPVYPGTANAWVPLATDRSGMCDLAILDRKPILLATVGGLHTTPDLGTTWSYVASGRQGYGALQISEVKGQFVESAATDLYFSTKDNYFWTADTGANVQDHREEDAFFVEAERRVPTPAESRITWRRGLETFQSGQDFLNPAPWPGPTGGSNAPVLLSRDSYVQNRNGGLDWTLNAGMTWQSFAPFSESAQGLPKVANTGISKLGTILYQAFPAGGAISLLRAHNFHGNGSVVHPAMVDFGGLGVWRTEDAAYPVFGVDSAAWSHVIAADVVNDRMMETTDGGETWTGMGDLTTYATHRDNDTLLFHIDAGGKVDPLVTAVSFSPQDPSLVVIGTAENGILVSSNRGVTWRKLDKSERAAHVSSFYWEDANTIYVSTYGRGLWKLTNRRIEVAGAFDDFCGKCDVVSLDGKPDRPPFDGSVLVFEGSILGVRTDDRRLREVLVTPGSSVWFTGDLKDEQEDIAITETEGKEPFESLPKPPDGWIVTGVVFTSDDTLTGAAFAEGEMSLLPPE